MVPRTVDTVVATVATISVLRSACQISRAPHSLRYHSSVNPSQPEEKREALNELITSTRTGR